jgi:hypothetical protein
MRIIQLAGEGSPPPGLRLTQAECHENPISWPAPGFATSNLICPARQSGSLWLISRSRFHSWIKFGLVVLPRVTPRPVLRVRRGKRSRYAARRSYARDFVDWRKLYRLLGPHKF